MKEFALMYEKENTYSSNNSNYFNEFYLKQKLIYPWLTKKSLCWHI